MAARSKMRVEATFEGFTEAENGLRAMGARAGRTKPLMEKMVGVLQTQQARRIEDSPYPELEPSTQARKEGELENPKPFRDEARFIKGHPTRVPEATYMGITQAHYPGQVRLATNASATFGLKSGGNGPFFYLRFAQAPTSHGRIGKKRKVLAISAENALALAEITIKWITFGWVRERRRARVR